MLPVFASAQDTQTISGTVSDRQSGKALAFATVSLKNSATGTICNENGIFDLIAGGEIKNDTLVISYMGYNTQKLAVSSLKLPVAVLLEKSSYFLKEVLVRPLLPQDYIRMAIRNISENYPGTPFQTLGYYKEQLKENKDFIRDEEAVFKTYYPNYQASVANQHQMLLHRKGEVKPLKFMKDKIDKAIEKENKKAKKNGEESDPIDPEEIISSFGGPEAILGSDFVNEREYFLDSTKFKNYDFSFGPTSTFLGKEIVVINFESRRRIDYQNQSGKIFIEPISYAIVSVEYSSYLEVPGIADGALFLLGIGIEDPWISSKYNYYEMDGKWYPQNFRADLSIRVIRKHIFKANEVTDFNIQQLFMINKIILDSPSPVEESKRFDAGKKFDGQEFNDDGLKWEDINTIKRTF